MKKYSFWIRLSLVVLIVCSFAVSATTSQAADISSGLVAYYPFNGNANDESGNGNNGTVNGAIPTTDRFGNANSAYRFNGVGDNIQVANQSLLNFESTQDFTICAWILCNSMQPGRYIVAKYDETHIASYGLGTGFTDGSYSFIRDALTPDPNDLVATRGTKKLDDGKWHHLLMTVTRNSKIRFYVDGVFELESTSLGKVTGALNNPLPLTIGSMSPNSTGWARNFEGGIDDVRIYNRALSAQEITQLYQSESSGLVAYYPFNGNANDESGNGNNGTVNGAIPTTDRFGNANSAYRFNGVGDNIQVANQSLLNFESTQDFTICAWILCNSMQPGRYIVAKYDETHIASYGLGTGFTDGSYSFIRDALTPDPNDLVATRGTKKLDDGKWHHLLMTVTRNSKIRFYVDGVFELESTSLGKVTGALNNPLPLTIGSMSPNSTGWARNFEGGIDDVRIYNRALSNSAVAALYSEKKPCTITFVVGSNGTLTSTTTQTVAHGDNASTVTAVPNTGYHFTGWSGDYKGKENPLTLTNILEDKSVTANFAINTYSVVFSAVANGSINGTKTQTIEHGANCTQVTAVPDENYHFTGWTGYYTGLDNPLTLTNVTSDKAITANFAHNTSTLSLNSNGNGTTGFTSLNPLNTRTATPILATPDANNHFVNWTVTSGSAIVANVKSAATTVTLSGDHGSSATITANFAEDAVPTVVTAIPVISATDGTYEDRVVITWKAVPSATSYEVYRNTTNTTDGSDLLGTVSDVIFEDNTAEFNNVYYYFAKAKNAIGSSDFSTGNSGYVAKAPSFPGTVTASDGTYFDKIRVSWAKVTGATSYRVFRTESTATAPNPNTNTYLIGETTALFLDDFGDDIVPQVAGEVKKYHYWIAAKNENATTAISKPNIGYLSNKGPTKVTASNGTYADRIVVTWTAVPGATAYDVYSYTDSKYTLNKTKVGDTVEALEYECIPITTDTPFYYRVNAKYALGLGSYDSALSLAGAVGKASGNSNPTATNINNGATSSNIVDMEKGSVIYFSTEVLFGTTRLVATLDGTSKLKTNDCDLFAKFANYPTFALYNAKGVENNVNESLTVSNPAAGTWYFMLYGVTAYSDVTLTVNSYAVEDIVLTQIPVNDLPVPFTAKFKGRVVDESGSGIPNIVVQTRNPITGLTSSLTKTDAKGIFSYSVLINSEGEHTFDFFFSEMPDPVKGTASHTVATRKGCFVEAPNNFFDFSAYLPATPVAVPLHADVIGLQNFLDTRNGWDENTINGTYAALWVNSTLAKTSDDAQFAALDEGLYILLYGVEGAGVGNDTTATPALSAVPFVVHVETSKKGDVLTALNTLGVINGSQKTAIEGGSGIIAVVSLSDPDEGLTPKSISLLACEQLELLAKLAAGAGSSSDGGTYSGVSVRKVTVALAGRKINVVAAGFVK